MRVALMITCLGDIIRPEVGKAVVRILRRLGHTVEFPEAQTCCGQPMFNSGFAELARDQAKHTIQVFEPYEKIVVPSGSCTAMVKHEYPHLFAQRGGDEAWRLRSENLAAKTFEFCDYLVNQLGVVQLGAKFQGKVAYHFACHLRMLQQNGIVEQLLRNVEGATIVPLNRQDQCCGFGGSFAVRYPQISGSMVDDKMRCLIDSGADAVVSTDAGCLMNIGGRLHREGHKLEVLHIAELLDRRTGEG